MLPVRCAVEYPSDDYLLVDERLLGILRLVLFGRLFLRVYLLLFGGLGVVHLEQLFVRHENGVLGDVELLLTLTQGLLALLRDLGGLVVTLRLI